MSKVRTYSEMSQYSSFESRFNYLKIGGHVGHSTFGHQRHLNQVFYLSREWKDVRNEVILRDMGRDLGILGREIHRGILVHHMNPVSPEEILHRDPSILDPEFLVTVSDRTHNAIHYGDISLLDRGYKPRTPNDTILWEPIRR